MPYRAISSYFSPGAAATRRPPAGRPARPAAGTLPPPARGLGPRRIRPAWGGGPGPGPAKPPPRGCAGRTRPRASWRAREGGGCPPESPRVPASPTASGPPARGLLRAVEPRAWPSPPRARERAARESAPGPGAGGGWAARDRSGGSALAPSALPGSGPPVARRGRAGRGSGCLWRERRLVVSAGRPPKLPPAGVAWDGYPGGLGGAEYGALPTLQVARRRLGGSSRRRAQSPFVRRNKERHCVFPLRRRYPPRGLGSSWDWRGGPRGTGGEVAYPFRRNGAFASDKTGGLGGLDFLPHPQAFVDSWVCHCLFCSDVHCFSPVVSLLLAPNFVRCI